MTIVKFLRNLPQDILYYIIVAAVWTVNLFIADTATATSNKQVQEPAEEEAMAGSLG